MPTFVVLSQTHYTDVSKYKWPLNHITTDVAYLSIVTSSFCESTTIELGIFVKPVRRCSTLDVGDGRGCPKDILSSTCIGIMIECSSLSHMISPSLGYS